MAEINKKTLEDLFAARYRVPRAGGPKSTVKKRKKGSLGETPYLLLCLFRLFFNVFTVFAGSAGAGPGLSAGPVVATGARPAGAPPSQGTRDPNSKFTDDEVQRAFRYGFRFVFLRFGVFLRVLEFRSVFFKEFRMINSAW